MNGKHQSLFDGKVRQRFTSIHPKTEGIEVRPDVSQTRPVRLLTRLLTIIRSQRHCKDGAPGRIAEKTSRREEGQKLPQQARVSESRRGDPTAKLRALIVGGRLMPNQRLVEAELVPMLRSNRANVRTALARLEQEGLVVSAPNRGARVRLVSDEEAIEITLARGALEALVVRQAAQNLTKADRVKLRRLGAEMRRALDAGDLILYSDLNGQLHTEFYRIAALPIVARLLLTLKSQLVRFQYRPVLLPGRAQKSIEEHAEIIKAVCAADPDWAERAMRDHIAKVLVALRRIIEEKPNTALGVGHATRAATIKIVRQKGEGPRKWLMSAQPTWKKSRAAVISRKT